MKQATFSTKNYKANLKIYKRWAKQHLKEVKRMCKNCGVVRSQKMRCEMCLICRDTEQAKINAKYKEIMGVGMDE